MNEISKKAVAKLAMKYPRLGIMVIFVDIQTNNIQFSANMSDEMQREILNEAAEALKLKGPGLIQRFINLFKSKKS